MMNALLAAALIAAAPPAGITQKNRPYDAQHYKLEVRQAEGGTFNNVATITVKAVKALPEIEFDAYDLKVTSAKVDGEDATFTPTYVPETRLGTLKVKPAKPVAAGKEAVVEIAYAVTAGTSHDGFFTASEPDAPKGTLPGYFTQFESTYAQRFFPVNDTPADKATTEIIAVVDARYAVVSNGRRELDEKFTEDGKNLRRVHWKQTDPHSPYLVALAIAQLEPIRVDEDIPATLWVPPHRKADAYVAADVLKQIFSYVVSFTGTKYPWAKLDVVAVPNFVWGGMENTSVIFERTSLLLVDHRNDQTARTNIAWLLAHEIAHQYFGNYVTCAWWNDIWLNEGFATYLGNLAIDDYENSEQIEIAQAWRLLNGYFREEDGPRSHPLVVKGLPVEEAFDATSYSKGGQVLRMLELWLGRAEFKKAVKLYLEKHAFGAATSDDFFKAVFESTKKEKELKPFKDAWLTKKGYPVITPSSNYANGKLTITIKQRPNHATEKGAFVFKLPIVIHRKNEPAYTQEEIITVDKPEVKVELDAPAAPEWINWNKNFGALVRIEDGSVSEDRLVDAARHDTDPVWRLVATLRLLGEFGNDELKEETRPTETALNAILDVITKDPSPYVRETVLRKLAATRFKKLPKDFAAPLYALSKKPTGLNDDAAGYIKVRNAAIEALARVSSDEGHAWFLGELGKRDIDINYLEAYAAAASRLGTDAALGSLRAALVTQKSRGFGYYSRAVKHLGKSRNPAALVLMLDAIKGQPNNPAFALELARALQGNRELRETQPFAAFIRDVVLDEANFTEETRHRFVGLLDDVKFEAAKQALTEIEAGTKSDRIKRSASHVLAANFPAPPPPAPEKPAKGKKK